MLELDPHLDSSRCGRIIAAFTARLDFGVYSTSDTSCSCRFSDSMSWKPGMFLLRSMKRGLHLAKFFYMSIF